MTARVVVELTNEDMVALYAYLKGIDEVPLRRRFKQIAWALLITVVLVYLLNMDSPALQLSSLVFCVGLVIVIAGIIILPELIHKLMTPRTNQSIMRQSKQELQIEGTRQYILTKPGIEVKTQYGDMTIDWSEINSFKADEKYLFFNAVDGKGSHIIPVKYFVSQEDARMFENELARQFYLANPGA